MNGVSLAKQAYSGRAVMSGARTRSADDRLAYFDLLADDVVVEFGVPAGTPLRGPFRGRQAVIELFTALIPALFDDLRLDEEPEYIGTGERVAVLGRESYTVKQTSVAVSGKAFADILYFERGQIVRNVMIKEMNEFVDACRMAADPTHVGGSA